MRDVILTAVIVGLLGATLRYPPVGAYLWAWLSLMNPHKLTYGFAAEFGFAQYAAVVALVALLITKQRYAVPLNALSVTWILFVLWMSVTSLFALNSAELVFERWIFVMKIQVMIAVTIALIRTRKHLDTLIWVVTLSIVYYGVKGGLFTIATAGASRVWGPSGSMVQDNNALAVALIMLVPFLYYLFQISQRKIVRWGLLGSGVACCFAILGSQSRGALVGVVMMAAVLAMKSKHAVRAMVVLLATLGVAFAFMPETWLQRMSTIRTYEGDNSAMSRVYTWKTLTNVAVDRPLVGAGFRADARPIFERYAPNDPEFAIFKGSAWVAHSIYFQALGEQGFVGLGLFILIGILVWRKAAKLAKLARGDPELARWVPALMPMIQVSLIGFATGGAFLSLAYFDLPYYLLAFVLIAEDLVKKQLQGSPMVAGAPEPARELAMRPQV